MERHSKKQSVFVGLLILQISACSQTFQSNSQTFADAAATTLTGMCPVPSIKISAASTGALPNDEIDDVAAINAAIASSPAGATVTLAEGRYLISSAIQLKSGVSLNGTSQAGTVIEYVGSNREPMIGVASGTIGSTIAYLTLDAHNNSSATAGIQSSDSQNHSFHHLSIKDFVGRGEFGPFGIYFSGNVKNSTLSDLSISNIGPGSEWGGGIRFSHGSSGNKILRNTISNAGRGGIFCNNNSTDAVIVGNNISRSGLLGLEVWGGCARALIEDNVVDHWLSVDTSHFSAIRRNTVTDTSGRYDSMGLELVNSNSVVFTDNTVGAGSRIGISISGGLAKEFIYWANNKISKASTWGIQIQGEEGQARYQYFYNNEFSRTLAPSNPDAMYPNQGHGIRINDNAHFISFDRTLLSENAAAVQVLGGNVSDIAILNSTIRGNASTYAGSIFWGFEWVNNSTMDATNNFSQNLNPQNRLAMALGASGTRQAGSLLTFSVASEDSIRNILWDFGEGLPSRDLHPQHTYPKPGNYRVSAVIWNSSGIATHAQMFLNLATPTAPTTTSTTLAAAPPPRPGPTPTTTLPIYSSPCL